MYNNPAKLESGYNNPLNYFIQLSRINLLYHPC